MRQDKIINFPLEIRKGSVRVKVYRTVDRGRDRYTLAYHEGTRRTLRQFADLGEAKKEGAIVAERLNAGQGDALELTGKDRDAYLHAVRKLRPLGIGLVPAIDEYTAAKKWDVPLAVAAQSYHEAHATKLPDKTVEEVYREMLAAKKNDGASKAYLHDLRSRLGHFSRDFRCLIATVATSDIDTWLRSLKLSARSRNNHRNAVVALFNFAKAAGYLNRERTTPAEHTSRARKKLAPIDIFTPQDFAKLLTGADDFILPFFVLGGFCGLRTAEILRLSWDDIRWQESSIIIRADVAKTRTRRLAPITTPAAAWLAGFKRKTGRVIPIDKPHPRITTICEAVKVEWKNNGLRHSFITYRVASTKDFVKTAYEAGNSPQVIRSNYDAVATEQEGKLWFSIMPETAENVVQMKGAA